MGFDWVDIGKSVVKDFVLFITSLVPRLTGYWLFLGVILAYIFAYSSVIHRTKSSAYITHFTGDGNILIRS